jgi:hypothetical protein
MSAEPMIRELFRSLETTLHERLSLIEQVLNTIEKPKVALYDNEFVKRIERLEHQQRHSNNNGSNDLEQRIFALEHQSGSRYLEDRIIALEEQLAATSAELEAMKNQPTATAHIPLAEEDVECEVLEEEAEEVEAEEEEAGLELEEFQHKGVTYFKDGDNNVYTTDEDGDVLPEPIARWNGVTGAGSKFLRVQ